MADEKRLIWADDALAAEFTIEEGGAIAYVVDSEVIRRLPTVDAVEVVRCKDCRSGSRNTPDGFHWPDGFAWCTRCKIMMNSCDFCSYGERRTGNENP